MLVQQYKSENKSEWDSFVSSSKIPHFMFYRDYIEYHSHRFVDFSLMVMDEKNRLIAIMPANIVSRTLHSHQGLTFGGIITDKNMKSGVMLDIFSNVIKFLGERDVSKWLYKRTPYIYHENPSDEDLYALFINDAKLIRRDLSTSIKLDNKIAYSELRKRSIKKALKNNVFVEQVQDAEELWDLITIILKEKYGVLPVHTLSEISFLKSLFPKNIKMYTARYENQIVSGVVTYETNSVIHMQYLASSDLGKNIGGLDLILDRLIANCSHEKKYFDFGISNENDGLYLNRGLISQKEGFGARGLAHDFYEVVIG